MPNPHRPCIWACEIHGDAVLEWFEFEISNDTITSFVWHSFNKFLRDYGYFDTEYAEALKQELEYHLGKPRPINRRNPFEEIEDE